MTCHSGPPRAVTVTDPAPNPGPDPALTAAQKLFSEAYYVIMGMPDKYNLHTIWVSSNRA